MSEYIFPVMISLSFLNVSTFVNMWSISDIWVLIILVGRVIVGMTF